MCGIIGLFTKEELGIHVAGELNTALTMLQHRGQDACGITTCDGQQVRTVKDNGLVSEVFNQNNLAKLTGYYGIGHVRYPTAGSPDRNEAQPFFTNYPYGIALAHNGNLINCDELRQRLLCALRCINTTSDSELMLNVFAEELERHIDRSSAEEGKMPLPTLDNLWDSVHETMSLVRGGYAVVVLIKGIGMLVFRDPHGIRPLCFGTRRDENGNIIEFAAASESVAIEAIGLDRERDVGAGEVLFLDMNMQLHTHTDALACALQPCIFEYVYLARPDSVMDNISVYEARVQMGVRLAERVHRLRVLEEGERAVVVDEGDAGYDASLPCLEKMIDVVMAVPDTSRHTAISIATTLGKKYIEGLSKNRYIARTFIMPAQQMRQKSIRIKHNPIHDAVKGLSVLVVDDSIVRGNTTRMLVKAIRQAGAKHVFVASAAPPVRFCNVYGIDMPTTKELIAHSLTPCEVAKVIDAEYVLYQSLEDLKRACRDSEIYGPGPKDFECSCFDGVYITGGVDQAYLDKLEAARIDSAKASA
ncbi:amidophosphoribosyltransferase [Blastocystis sp. ATCC 50177/Nand II]|uniref:Amidophosphoribosyltransferase n=1 Tax=Blastocystis sp. subtype 1 (strain ATCC 50177 / NandII) TaxID=478820 RepID=A0A196SQZ7_BLAHN|nr:amidophosphoribosyltransferase [Blastocystis sp. ATCC 50177/Nand II]